MDATTGARSARGRTRGMAPRQRPCALVGMAGLDIFRLAGQSMGAGGSGGSGGVSDNPAGVPGAMGARGTGGTGGSSSNGGGGRNAGALVGGGGGAGSSFVTSRATASLVGADPTGTPAVVISYTPAIPRRVLALAAVPLLPLNSAPANSLRSACSPSGPCCSTADGACGTRCNSSVKRQTRYKDNRGARETRSPRPFVLLSRCVNIGRKDNTSAAR